MELEQSQWVNHFQGSSCLTTKVGLIHTLKNSVFFSNRRDDTFFPRSYDLAKEIHEFVTDFLCLQTITNLQQLLEKSKVQRHSANGQLKVNHGLVSFQLRFLERQYQNKKFQLGLVDGCIKCNDITTFEFELLRNCHTLLRREVSRSELENFIDSGAKRYLGKTKKYKDDWDKNKFKKSRRIIEKLAPRVSCTQPLNDIMIEKVNKTLEECFTYMYQDQKEINGITSNNLWIVK